MGPGCGVWNLGVGDLSVGDLGVWDLGVWDLGVWELGVWGTGCVCGRPGFGGHGCVQPVIPFRQGFPHLTFMLANIARNPDVTLTTSGFHAI